MIHIFNANPFAVSYSLYIEIFRLKFKMHKLNRKRKFSTKFMITDIHYKFAIGEVFNILVGFI